MTPDTRWTQRLRNFDGAVMLLREPIARGVDSLSQLEKQGVVQRIDRLHGWLQARIGEE